jgi:hypothetical protein
MRARLLSGLVFLNGCPAIGTDAPRPQPLCRIFLNGGAKQPLQVADFEAFQKAFRGGVVVTQLAPPSGTGKRPEALALRVVVMAAALGWAFWRRASSPRVVDRSVVGASTL